MVRFRIYGVVANFNDERDEWILDEEATEKSRQEMLNERKEKSMTFEEFWEYERKKITENKLKEGVSRMYFESLSLSDNWAKEFLEFWKLPSDFKMEVKIDNE